MKKPITAYTTLTIGTILGILFAYLFCWKIPGISVPIFVISTILAYFTVVIINKTDLKPNFNILYFIPISICSLAFFIHSHWIVWALNLIIIPTGLILASIWSTYPNVAKLGGIFSPVIGLIFAIAAFVVSIPSFIVSLLTAKLEEKIKSRILVNTIVGLIITLPLLIIVLALLSAADLVFAEELGKISKYLIPDLSAEYIGKWIVGIIVAVMSSIFLFSLIISKVFHQKEQKRPEKPSAKISSIIMTVVGSTLSLVYLGFIIIQFVYLFGGEKNISGKGHTYAEYAHKGFGELIAIALINLVLVLILQLRTRQKHWLSKIVINGLGVFLILATGVIIYSSHLRLYLYENAYGWSHKRIYSHVFTFFIAALFIVLLANIAIRRIAFVSKGFLITSIISFTIFSLIPIDMIIAQKNIEREENGHKVELDAEYLTTLSPDALSSKTLDKVLDKAKEYDRDSYEVYNICNNLRGLKADSEKRDDHWQSLNLGSISALKALEEHENEIERVCKGVETYPEYWYVD